MAGMTRDDVFRELDSVFPLAASFIDQDFTGANLRHLNLAGAEFLRATFTGSDLSRVSFYGAELTRVSLSKATMEEVDFRDASICDSDFSGAELRFSQFLDATMGTTRFDGADVSYASFNKVSFRDVSFVGANLTDSRLTFRIGSGDVNFENADLTAAFIEGRLAGQSNFRGANLTDADLSALKALRTDFTGADLTGAVLPKDIGDPTQLLGARGSRIKLHQTTWDQLLPDDPHAQGLALELLDDWDGTIGEAIETAKTLRTA